MKDRGKFSRCDLGERLHPPALNLLLKSLILLRITGSQDFPLFQCFPVNNVGEVTLVHYVWTIHSLITHLFLPAGVNLSPLHYFNYFKEKAEQLRVKNTKFLHPTWYLEKMELKFFAPICRTWGRTPQVPSLCSSSKSISSCSSSFSKEILCLYSKNLDTCTVELASLEDIVSFETLLKTNFTCESTFYYLKVFA